METRNSEWAFLSVKGYKELLTTGWRAARSLKKINLKEV